MDGLLNAELKGKLITGRPWSQIQPTTSALQVRVEYANLARILSTYSIFAGQIMSPVISRQFLLSRVFHVTFHYVDLRNSRLSAAVQPSILCPRTYMASILSVLLCKACSTVCHRVQSNKVPVWSSICHLISTPPVFHKVCTIYTRTSLDMYHIFSTVLLFFGGKYWWISWQFTNFPIYFSNF